MRSFTARGRRAQIVAATVRVIAREGVARAAFGRIAAEAGLSSPGMISYHFADKDELLTMLCDTVIGDCVSKIESAVSGASCPVQKLAAYLTSFIGWQDSHREEVSALWQLAAAWRRPGGEQAFDEAPLVAPLLRILQLGRADGVLRDGREDWIAQTIFCAAKGFQQAQLDDPDLDAPAFARTLIDLFTDGLVVP